MFALYCSFTVLNLSTMYFVYFPYLRETFRINVLPSIRWTIALYKLFDSWTVVACLYLTLLEIRIKQYLTNSCVKINYWYGNKSKNTYRLTHVIDGELVTIDIVKRTNRPINIVSCEQCDDVAAVAADVMTHTTTMKRDDDGGCDGSNTTSVSSPPQQPPPSSSSDKQHHCIERTIYNEAISFMRYVPLEFTPSRSVRTKNAVKVYYENGVVEVFE